PGGTAGTGETLTVTAEDPYGNTDPSYTGTVQFTSSDAQAVLPANATLTDGVGSFTVTLKTAGTQSVTATDTVTTSIAGTETGIAVTPAAATPLAVAGAPGGTAGTGETLTVTAEDPYGNTDPSYTGTVQFTSSDAQAVLPANATLTDGVGSFTVTLKTAGTQSVTATDTVTTSIAGTETGITVTPAAATHLAVAGAPGGTAGTGETLTVTAEDPYGNTDPSYTGTVQFTSGDAQAVLPANATLTDGVGSFTVTLKTAGTQSVTATDTVTTSIAGTETGIAVTPASATHFTVTGLTGGGAAGTALTLTVTAEDPYGNTATGYTGTVHFTSSDQIAVLPANSSLTNGVGSFTVTLKTAGVQSVTVTDTATSITGMESGITVNQASTTTVLTSSDATSVYGESVTFTATVTGSGTPTGTVTFYAGAVN